MTAEPLTRDELADARSWVGPKPRLANAETGAVALCRRLLDTVDALTAEVERLKTEGAGRRAAQGRRSHRRTGRRT